MPVSRRETLFDFQFQVGDRFVFAIGHSINEILEYVFSDRLLSYCSRKRFEIQKQGIENVSESINERDELFGYCFSKIWRLILITCSIMWSG